MVVSVELSIGVIISAVPLAHASMIPSPACSCIRMFSDVIRMLSIIIPTTRMSPERLRMLSDIPNTKKARKVIMSATVMLIAVTTGVLKSPIKTNATISISTRLEMKFSFSVTME